MHFLEFCAVGAQIQYPPIKGGESALLLHIARHPPQQMEHGSGISEETIQTRSHAAQSSRSSRRKGETDDQNDNGADRMDGEETPQAAAVEERRQPRHHDGGDPTSIARNRGVPSTTQIANLLCPELH